MNKENFLHEYNGSILSSSEIISIMGNRMALTRLKEEGVISLLTGKIYAVGDFYEPSREPYMIISKYYPQAVISGNTALYLHNLGEYLPERTDIDIPRDSSILKESEYFNVTHTSASRMIGIENIDANGVTVRAYNRERCLIELLKGGQSTNQEFFQKAINEYFNQGVDLEKLNELKIAFKGEVNTILGFISFLNQQNSVY